MRGRAFGIWAAVLALYGGLVISCAGSFASVPPTEDAEAGPISPGTGPDADARAPTPTVDATVSPPDSGECNGLEPKAGAKSARSVAGAPPAPRGGTITNGTFDMVDVVVYRGQSFPVSVESAIEMESGVTFRMTTRALGASSRLAGTYKGTGTLIAIKALCSNGISIVSDNFGYSSEKNGDVLKLYGSFEGRDLEYVYQRR